MSLSRGLDLGVGRGVLGELCDECRGRLEERVGVADVLAAASPRGYKRLVGKVVGACCGECRGRLWSAGLRGGGR